MKKHKKIFGLLVILFLVISLIFPQQAHASTSFANFTNTNFTHAVVRDGDYLWIGSSGGVVARRISDGSLVTFTTADGLVDNEVSSLVIDAFGRKWIGTPRGLGVLDDHGTPLNKTDDQWQSFTTTDGFIQGGINGITIDTAGRKWLATYAGLAVLDDAGTPFNKADDRWYTFPGSNTTTCSAASSIAIDSANRKWIGCFFDGLRVLNDNGTLANTSDDQWQSFTNTDGLASTLIWKVVIDNAGRKWLASWSTPGGAAVLDDNGTPFNKGDDHWQNFSKADSGLAGNGVYGLAIDASGNKWWGTDGGISVLNDNGTPLNKSDDKWITFTTADGLASTTFGRYYDIFIDTTGIKWIAANGGGVSRLDDKGTPFIKTDDLWQTLTTNNKLANNYINNIAIDTLGKKWIATYGGGANVLDDNNTPANPIDDQWQTFSEADGLPSIVYAIAIDSTGKKWFGVHDYFVKVLDDGGTPFNKTDDQWQTFTTTDGLASIVNDITIDTSGRKWFATWGGVSVLNDNGTIFNKGDDQWQTFTTTDGLANNMVWKIAIDSFGRKWMSTRDGGVSVLDDGGTPFNKADDKWTTFTGADASLPGLNINLMKIDSFGRKWMSTNGGGFCVLDDKGTPFNKSDDQWQCFSTADGAGTNSPQAMLIDTSGRKWITGDGLTLFDDGGTPFNKSDDHYRVFHSSDGLTSNGTTALASNNQDLWVGTVGGLSILLNYLTVPVIPNHPPTANAGGPYTVAEGSTVALSGSGSDPDNDPITFAWDLDNNGTFETPGQNVTFSAAGRDGPSSQTVVLQVCDNKGACTTASTTVNITNVAPTVGAITAPGDPLAVNSPVNVSATFTDPGVLDTHTAVWNWGDGTSSPGIVTETNGSGSVTGSHTYVAAGVYTLQLTVTDKDGGIGQNSFNYIVIFDSTAGFVTGGGIINSPTGAYPQDPSLTGRATFGFSAKYLPGDTAPSGGSQFKFRLASINFSGTNYQWLVISGAKAIFKGTGTNNGIGNYTFLVSTIDGVPDRYRIKITDNTTNTVFYDNEIGSPETADPTTPLVVGSIVIH